MRILWNELKKIITWKMLLLLVIVNSILYFLLIEFDIKYFPNGRPDLDSYNIGNEMIEKYGTHMDETEFADFKQTYETEGKEFQQFLQGRKEFVEAGMDTYEKFRNFDRENEELYALHSKLFFEENVDSVWELQERKKLIEFYERKEEGLNLDLRDAKAWQKDRLLEMKEKGLYGVYPETVIRNFKTFILSVAITIMISVVVFISPIFLKDRMGQLLFLQYTSQKGRHLYKTKVLAGLISTFLLITTLLIIYLSFYSLNNTSMYFDVPIHMFIGEYNWYDPTFFRFIVINIVAIYVLGFIMALLAITFSNIVANYVVLIGVQIPILAGTIGYGLLYLITSIISIGIPKVVVPTMYSSMLLLGIGLLLYMWKRERKLNIIE